MKKELEDSNMQRRLAANRLDKVLGKPEKAPTVPDPTAKQMVKPATAKYVRRLVPVNA